MRYFSRIFRWKRATFHKWSPKNDMQLWDAAASGQFFSPYNFMGSHLQCFAFKRGYPNDFKRLIIAISNNSTYYYSEWSKLLFINLSFNATLMVDTYSSFSGAHQSHIFVSYNLLRLVEFRTFSRNIQHFKCRPETCQFCIFTGIVG